MTRKKEPMPLSELPGYIDSVRENGSSDYVPVVDVGRIVDSEPRWLRSFAYSAAACLVLSVSMFAYVARATKEITIVMNTNTVGVRDIEDVIAQEGGRIISVKQEEDGIYKVKVFSFKSFGSLLERLRENKDLKRADAEGF